MSNFTDFYKKNRKLILSLLWIFAVLIIAATIVKNNFGSDSFLSFEDDSTLQSLEEDEIYNTYSFNANKIEDIQIALVAEKLSIQPVNSNEITVELCGTWSKKLEPEVSYTNNTLIIKQKQKNGVNWHKRSVVVKLPAEKITQNTITKIENVSGSVQLSDFEMSKLNISNVSGSIKLSNIVCKSSNLECVSGSVKIENCSIEDLEIATVSGSTKSEGYFDELNADAVSGSIKVLNQKDFTKDSSFSTISGAITIDLPSDTNAKIDCSSTSGSVLCEHTNTKSKSVDQKLGSGTYELEANSMSGSIKIQ